MDKFIFLMAVTGIVIVGLVMFSNALRRKQQNQMHNRLLDKFTSAQDLSTFLQSPGGRQYVSNLTDAVGSPFPSIISSVRNGIIACFVGGGCFVPYFRDAEPGLPIRSLGVLLIFLGLGFIVSAGATYQLSRMFRLMPPRDDSSQ